MPKNIIWLYDIIITPAPLDSAGEQTVCQKSIQDNEKSFLKKSLSKLIIVSEKSCLYNKDINTLQLNHYAIEIITKKLVSNQ